MNQSYYEHCGKHLTSEIAAEFIFKKYCDNMVSESCLSTELFEYHKNGGGLPPAGTLFSEFNEYEISKVVECGLFILKRNQCANQVDRDGNWWIQNRNNRSHHPKRIGSGNESVYVFYLPAERDRKVLSVPVWKSCADISYPCNIGMSARNPVDRVKTKTKNTSESAVIALIMQTEQGKTLELIIQRILKYKGCQCKSRRTDWFNTTPEEVEKIFNAVESL